MHSLFPSLMGSSSPSGQLPTYHPYARVLSGPGVLVNTYAGKLLFGH